MNLSPLALTALLAALPFSLAGAEAQKAAPKFYPYCVEVGVKGMTPHSMSEQAKWLREIGYDGAATRTGLDGTLDADLKALDEAGLPLYFTWTGLNLDPKAAVPYDPRLPAAIRKLKGRPVTVAFTITGLKPGDPAGIEPAVKALRELGDVAKEAGVRISIYNHVNNWAESVPFNIEVVKRVNHPQVGYNFNLCHWLKVEGTKDYRPLLRANAAKLFSVTISGAQIGAATWTNGLIQPLDRGDFDNRALLAAVEEIGYRGPIGLMCYGIPDDAREHLTRSMKIWRSWWQK
jgi:sugar phosphate isomerase/epimerase